MYVYNTRSRKRVIDRKYNNLQSVLRVFDGMERKQINSI